ncbi:hypothetical protein PENSPDRAFT_87644 [Peniophora sp. CONT]|nr:hypothetical protein PENSPDRAFT_87644 [Peniophora sp. CONT]
MCSDTRCEHVDVVKVAFHGALWTPLDLMSTYSGTVSDSVAIMCLLLVAYRSVRAMSRRCSSSIDLISLTATRAGLSWFYSISHRIQACRSLSFYPTDCRANNPTEVVDDEALNACRRS